ncbi:MAG TPA: chemotaxis protein CheA [Syntrophorhabdaceae bacterium]|jgi:two-component system chemotaxis sensor kinase CheA
MSTPVETFRVEAYERLQELESSLLELEEAPENEELIGQIFRALHTIKGSGAMFGFDDIASFTHEVETVFDMVRNGKIAVEKELIDLTLKAGDLIHAMLDGKEPPERDALTASFQHYLPGAKEEKASGKPREIEEELKTYRIRFRPEPDIFASGTNPIPLLNELRQLGDATVIAQLDAIPSLEDMNPELCYTYWDIVLTTDKGVNAIKDVFIFVEDLAEITIDTVEEDKLLGEIMLERGDVKKEDLERVLKDKKPIGELLVDAGLVTKDKVVSALAEQSRIKEAKEKVRKEDAASSIRVAADKLDKLVNLVGELVTVQARLTQKSSTEKDPELTLIAEEVERLTEELRDTTMSIRMLPIGTTFSKFKRLVRDLSSELGKEIDLTTEGGETELDKTVIEKLNDPLVHIIRNSVDHGVESPDIREAAGKPRQGMVHLSAKHSGAYVLVEITDDGAGLNRERIRAKAVERGLLTPEQEISDKDLFGLIFAAGFSTAANVTNVSGRGVGMDVVKKTIDSLRGSIEVQSEEGVGTTISLKLPLTLAIIEGLLVEIGTNHFVLPLSAVEECVELTREDVKRTHGRHMANVRGSLIPYMRLREEFNIKGEEPELEQIVITEIDRTRMGFVVDHVIGQHQTVIKTLGRAYRDVEGISGATILGDGTVALIVDVARLRKMAEEKPLRAVASR